MHEKNIQRVVYAPSCLPAWVETARILQETCSLEPVAWFGSLLGESVASEFPSIPFFHVHELWKDKWQQLSSSRFCASTDTTLARQLEPHWDRIMSLFARRGGEWVSSQHSQMRQRVYAIYAFCYGLLQSEQVDYVIFAEAPHNMTSYLLYAAAKNLQVRTLMFARTALPDRLFVTDDIGGMPISLSSTETSGAGAQEILASHPDTKQFLDRLRTSSPHDNAPNYVSTNKQREINWLKEQESKAKPGAPKSVAFKKTAELKQAYEAVMQGPTSNPFVLVALHYQPEKTTNPDGGIYDEQSLLIRLLSKCVPSGWEVCVKEHPTQFYHTMRGALARTPEFYQSLAQLNNVRFVNYDLPGLLFASQAEAIATVTGVIGFEAAVQGIPVLAFGMPWYAGCPGVSLIRTEADLRLALSGKKSNIDRTEHTNAIDEYVASLLENSFAGFINPSNESLSNVQADCLASRFSSALSIAITEHDAAAQSTHLNRSGD